jgi:hypothetical protein
MAHFAKLGLNNEVIGVHVVDNVNLLDADGNEQEQIGIDYLLGVHGSGTWVQTSYNTLGGEHSSGGTPLRKNYASIGGTYDASLDAFVSPQPFTSWILNEETCLWESPIPYPDDGNVYYWNEDTQGWVD